MASLTANAIDTYYIELDGKTHELIVTSRIGNPELTAREYDAIQDATIYNWQLAYAAWSRGIEIQEQKDMTAAHIANVEISRADQYCTIWNKDYNGVTITIHSSDLPSQALQMALSQSRLRDRLRDKGLIKMQKPATTGNTSPLPQGQPNIVQAWARGIKKGLVGGLVSIESGSMDSPNYNIQAVIAIYPYSYEETVDQTQYKLWELNGHIQVKEGIGKNGESYSLLLIPLQYGKSFSIFKQDDFIMDTGGVIPSDWHKCLKHLGMWDEQNNEALPMVRQGFLAKPEGAKYLCVKFRVASNGKTYHDYAGFYRAMETETETNEVDYNDIPF